MKKSRVIIVIAVMIFLILFAYGSSLRTNCTQIDGCTGCWQMTAVQITSDLCPGSNATYNASCTAEPYQQQHNAIVDALLCACKRAGEGGYADTELNSEIEDIFRNHMGYVIDAAELCDNPGITLVKMRYS